MSIQSQRGGNCFCSPQTIVHKIQTRLVGACRELNCLRGAEHGYPVEKKYVEGVCMWKTNTKRGGRSVRKGHNMTYRGQRASKQKTENNTEPKQVNRPVKTGYTVFWSLLQRLCCLSLSKRLFITGAVLVSGRPGRSAVQMRTPCLDCFTARDPGTTWVRAEGQAEPHGVEKRPESHFLFFPG